MVLEALASQMAKKEKKKVLEGLNPENLKMRVAVHQLETKAQKVI
jgi:hypothetical protein